MDKTVLGDEKKRSERKCTKRMRRTVQNNFDAPFVPRRNTHACYLSLVHVPIGVLSVHMGKKVLRMTLSQALRRNGIGVN